MAQPLSATVEQVAAFRLDRHHLVAGRRAPIETVCGDVCGIQAQVMSAAELALWTRIRDVSRSQIRDALWERRTLVKTSLMRQTLHLVPAEEFTLYVTALRRSRTAMLHRLFARLRVSPAEVTQLTGLVADILGAGPLAQQELVERIRPKVSKRVKLWLKYAWSASRPAIVQGLICYGPPRGSEVTFVRTDQWLPPQPNPTEETAKRAVLRRFLAAYGPATVRDFSKWSGIGAGEAKQVWDGAAAELQTVTVEGATLSLLKTDVNALAGSRLDDRSVRLLPSFDPLLLAHAAKDHLVETRFYKRVYRNQGWLSPVVLAGGKVVAVWFPRTNGKSVDIEIQPFARLSSATRAAIVQEAEALGRFLDAPSRAKM